ncbi:hypothetical protein pb186bvf_011552 [Paramecium bursaria]
METKVQIVTKGQRTKQALQVNKLEINHQSILFFWHRGIQTSNNKLNIHINMFNKGFYLKKKYEHLIDQIHKLF